MNVEFKCGECQPRPEVSPAILKGYTEAAKEAGTSIDPKTSASLVVTEYRERSDAARFLAGALAGPDKIVAKLSTPQGTKEISDSAITILNGIEDVGSFEFRVG